MFKRTGKSWFDDNEPYVYDFEEGIANCIDSTLGKISKLLEIY